MQAIAAPVPHDNQVKVKLSVKIVTRVSPRLSDYRAIRSGRPYKKGRRELPPRILVGVGTVRMKDRSIQGADFRRLAAPSARVSCQGGSPRHLGDTDAVERMWGSSNDGLGRRLQGSRLPPVDMLLEKGPGACRHSRYHRAVSGSSW